MSAIARHGYGHDGDDLLLGLIQPLAEDSFADLLQCRTMAGGILPDGARVNSGLAKLGRVADQPGFDPLRLCLDVELNSEQVFAFPESLDGAMRRERKVVAPRRQIEIVAVPMQDVKTFEVSQRACLPGRRQRDRSPPDFLRRAGRDLRSKRLGHELRAKTNTKRRAQSCKPAGDRAQLAGKKRVGIFLVDADRSAQHDQKVTALELRGLKSIHAGIKVSRFEPAPRKNGCQRAQILERNVTKNETCFHQGRRYWLGGIPLNVSFCIPAVVCAR
jgi:hypothetical protein